MTPVARNEESKKRVLPDGPSDPHWSRLAEAIQATPEFALIPFHPLAGQVSEVGERQFFFDGGATEFPWGDGDLHWFMREVRGAAEPQEILPFLRVLDALAADPPGPRTVVELGAGWGMYSIVAGRRWTAAELVLIEAHPRLLEVGRRNLALNGLSARARVIHAAAHEASGQRLRFKDAAWGSHLHAAGEHEVVTVSVDGLLFGDEASRSPICDDIAVLHMDVQGAEDAVLRGGATALGWGHVRAVFVGTHSNKVHDCCAAILELHGYRIVVSIDLDRTASGDGILVALHPDVAVPGLEHAV